MSVDLRIDVANAEVRAAVERLRLAMPLGGDMSPAMQSMARVLKTGAQLRFRFMKGPDGAAWAPSRRAQTEGGQTLSLTRRLRNSITAAHSSTTAAVGTNVAYAAIHQFGGVIRAKRGPFLAIPVTDAARAAGSPTRMAGLAVWQTLGGQFVMGTAEGTVHFLLRRQVVMPERPFLGASDADRGELLRVLKDYADNAWRRR